MSNFENTLNNASVAKPNAESTEKKKRSYQEIRELQKKELDDIVRKAVSTPENLTAYLNVQSRFERYSTRNNLMIFNQRPNATRLKSMELWNKDKLFVNEKAKAIYIYEPKTVIGENGTEYTNFVRKRMFDIADIKDAKPEPQVQYDIGILVRALFAGKTVNVEMRADYPADRKFGAYYDPASKCIFARKGMNYNEIFVSVSQALAHADMARGEENYIPAQHQFEARCAAYILAKKYGVATDALAYNNIPDGISGMDSADILKKLDGIHDSAKSISHSMYKELTKDVPQNVQNKDKGGKDER